MTRTILLYGNCQAEHLAHIGHFLPSLRDRIVFKVIPLHLVTGRTGIHAMTQRSSPKSTYYGTRWRADRRPSTALC